MESDDGLDERARQDRIARKAVSLSAFMKQLIALDVAAIGFYTVFAERFSGSGWLSDFALALTPITFLVSLITSVAMLLALIRRQVPSSETPDSLEKDEEWVFMTSFMAFIVGVTTLFVPTMQRLFSMIPDWFYFVSALGMIFMSGYLIGRKLPLTRTDK